MSSTHSDDAEASKRSRSPDARGTVPRKRSRVVEEGEIVDDRGSRRELDGDDDRHRHSDRDHRHHRHRSGEHRHSRGRDDEHRSRHRNHHSHRGSDSRKSDPDTDRGRRHSHEHERKKEEEKEEKAPLEEAFVEDDDDVEDEVAIRERIRQKLQRVAAQTRKKSIPTGGDAEMEAPPTEKAREPDTPTESATAPVVHAPKPVERVPEPVDHERESAVATAAAASLEDDDEDFDMFSEEADRHIEEQARRQQKAVIRNVPAAVENESLSDNWDDSEGYYRHRIGEVLDGRYLITKTMGRGMFGEVVMAQDVTLNDHEVAIKIIRSNDLMRSSARKEAQVMSALSMADPDDRKHCLRMYRHFEFRNHLCLCFEPMSMNLRQVLEKYGKEQGRRVGINIDAVRIYAGQLFIALGLLRKVGLCHCDIKPDNMLVNETLNRVKLSDFGSALFEHQINNSNITGYLVARFYRAPEIILGCHPLDSAVDMWSVGCSLYEMFTGKILFNGTTNNSMLKRMMDVRGAIPPRMLKRSQFGSQHFAPDGRFIFRDTDPVTQKPTEKLLTFTQKGQEDYFSSLMAARLSDSREERTKIKLFKDLLDRCFTLDPRNRLTVDMALNHPFVKPKE